MLASGDWIPGTLIVASSLIGLASQIPIINKLCHHAAALTAARQADRLTLHGSTRTASGSDAARRRRRRRWNRWFERGHALVIRPPALASRSSRTTTAFHASERR